MRKLQKPNDDPAAVFLTCISHVSDAGLKRRLTSVETDVAAAAEAFETAASNAALHTVPTHVNIRGVVSKDEMSDVYDLRMARTGTPGRPIYDKLLAAPANDRCPLCGQRTVSTLDHHLPKAHYPALAVVPSNLVPACFDCNKAKGHVLRLVAGEQTLHPYFDDVEGDRWLYAEVVQGPPAALRFFVRPPADWDLLKSQRVRFHFNVFKLANLYASHAAEELQNIRYSLTGLFAQAGLEAVRVHLAGESISRRAAHTNSWQTAMYNALEVSDWFCGGGF